MHEKLIAIVIAIILFVICMLLIMWGWSLFMVPVFKMAPLTFSQAFGFALLGCAFGKTNINKG